MPNHDARLSAAADNGTTTLFAALNVANGEVYGLSQQKHRHQEWLRFLRMIDQTVPAEKEIYLICDNYATHKHERVQRWLAKHTRFHVSFTPTSASWLNMVERFFRDITHNRIRRGVFQDLEQLIMAIGNYIDVHNQNPKPFIWTATTSYRVVGSQRPMLDHRRTLRDVDQRLRTLPAVRGDADVMMTDRDDVVALSGGRMHSDALGTVADLHRQTGSWYANRPPDFLMHSNSMGWRNSSENSHFG